MGVNSHASRSFALRRLGEMFCGIENFRRARVSYSMKKNNSIKVPTGFLFSAVEAAVKKPGRKDLGLIFSECGAAVAGMFTTNRIKAAPVRLDMQRVRRGLGRAVIVNSGNANACTGPKGMRDARDMADSAANTLGVKPTDVFVCSTGVIGTPMPMQRILAAVPGLILGLPEGSIGDVAAAIMTTDTFPKLAAREVTLGGKTVTISGVCKGAGMISPTMATMLCFLMTDARVDHMTLKAALADAVAHSFNRISIDGDMSTNDTALILANGMAGNRAVAAGSRDYRVFSNALSEVADELATMIVKDGEGATKLVTVEVINARNEREALKGARAIADSLLVKTALYGNDANWGRLMAALGYAGILIREERVDISINGVAVAKSGVATGRDREANEALKAKEVRLVADLHLGKGRSMVLTCDLTEDYVKINAEYRT